jgi:hypothetical protein
VDKMYNLLKMGPHIVYAEDPKTLWISIKNF